MTTLDAPSLKPAVAAAIDELKKQFGDQVQVTELGDGGCRIVVEEVELGLPYSQASTWIGFTITPLYPYADIYPHFVRPDLRRIDDRPLGEGLHKDNNFYGQPAVMVSRRTRAFGADTPNNALIKLLKVQAWLKSL